MEGAVEGLANISEILRRSPEFL